MPCLVRRRLDTFRMCLRRVELMLKLSKLYNWKSVCRLCGSKQNLCIDEISSLVVPSKYPLKEDLKVTLCNSCGFVGNLSSSTLSDYKKYYTDFNKHHVRDGYLEKLDKDYFYKIFNIIKSYDHKIIEGATILDFGSGAKLLSQIARSKGAKICESLDVGNRIANRKYDIVITTHTFEHILNFNMELSRIEAMLKNEGLCLIAVPDLRGYNDYYYGPFNCFDLEHVNHFDFETLSLALEKNHLVPQKVLESHRLVNEALAYPEVLILAKKTRTQTKKRHKTIRQPRKEVLSSYIRKSKHDIKMSLKYTSNKYKIFNKKAALYGIYGLSSSAFRFLKIAKKEFGNIKFDWFADSDNRLNKKRIFEIPILNKKEFIKYAKINRSKTIIAFIVAVNAHRIVRMLKNCKLNNLKIMQVPPRCKNRV